MNLEAHLGYRTTGKLFIHREQNGSSVNLLKALIEQSSRSAYCDIDNDEQHDCVALVFDIQVGGNLTQQLFTLFEHSCAYSNRLSTVSLTPISTMLPKLYYFGNVKVQRENQEELVLLHVKHLLDTEKVGIEFVQKVMQAFLDKSDKNYLINALQSLKEASAE